MRKPVRCLRWKLASSDLNCDFPMSTEFFTKLCLRAQLSIPTNDADVRKLLSEAGAKVLDSKSAAATKLRKEHAAAILWARKNIDNDGAWKNMPEEARDTLVALFPVKQSMINKGGDAWTVPCRALFRAHASPPPSPKQRTSARITMGARSEESSGNSSDSSQSDELEPPKKKASGGASAKLGGKEGSPPYLPSQALLAVLPPQRRAQLYLAETWSTQTKAEREKHLERIMSRSEYGGRFEDPDAPAWSQRISVCRGPGSSFSDAEIRQDGKNLALILRWDSMQLLFAIQDYEGIHRMQTRAERVRATWDRFTANGRARVAPSTAVLHQIFQAIHEVLDLRLTNATGELADAGAAGDEILSDMARQKKEVLALFTAYEQFINSLYASVTLDYGVATRRANSIWYGLLHPAVAYLTQNVGSADTEGLDAQADAAFRASSSKRPRLHEESSTSERHGP